MPLNQLVGHALAHFGVNRIEHLGLVQHELENGVGVVLEENTGFSSRSSTEWLELVAEHAKSV